MKQRLSDSLLRKERYPDAPMEVYDTIESGLVARIRPSGHVSFWLYENRGRKKTKLADWPSKSTKKARILCVNEKLSEDNHSQLHTSFEDFIELIYKPAYCLDHSNDKGLSNLKQFVAIWGDLDLEEINEETVDYWRQARRQAGIRASTVNRNIAALKAVFSHAVRRRYLLDHPLKDMRRLRVDQEHRIRYLSSVEKRSLSEALIKREHRIRQERDSANQWRAARGYILLPDLNECGFADYLLPMVRLSLNTGLRQGELFSLKWGSISDEYITVTASNSKSRRSRHVPLNSVANETLRLWEEQTDGDGYVFKGRVGKFDNVRKAWRGVLNEAKILDFKWHDMRHDFASNLVMNDVALNTVRELLGHADIKTTLRYSHLAQGHLQEAVGKLTYA